MILNFWIHFENLPGNSTDFSLLRNSFSTQLAENKTQSFMSLLIRFPNIQLTANFSAKNQLTLTAIFWANSQNKTRAKTKIDGATEGPQ